jgi:uncharacterized protein HemX
MHTNNYILAAWAVWAALGIVLLMMMLYRINLTKNEEDRLFLADGDLIQHAEQEQLLAKLHRLQPKIRVVGGLEGLLTLGIVAFYVMDALRQF